MSKQRQFYFGNDHSFHFEMKLVWIFIDRILEPFEAISLSLSLGLNAALFYCKRNLICVHISGQQCESDVNECEWVQCQNGGDCVNTRGSYHCQCAPGFRGMFCDLPGITTLGGQCIRLFEICRTW